MINLNTLNNKAKKHQEEYKKLAIEDIEALVESLQDFQEDYLETWIEDSYCGEEFTEEDLENFHDDTIDIYVTEVVFKNTYSYDENTINYIRKQIDCQSKKFNDEQIIKMYLREHKNLLLV